jgi:hemoglobin
MSIYDSIGGEPALTAVVDDLYVRILADPQLSGFFAGVGLNRLKGRQVEFFGMALGGPMIYQGVSMKAVHAGKGIGQEHFNLVAGHLVASLAAAGVPEATIGEIVGLVAPLSGDIVSMPVSAE